MRTDNFTDKIKTIKNDLAELKSSQFSGSSNIISYISKSTNTWDVNWTVASVGGPGYAEGSVNAILTTNEFTPFSALEMSVLYNGVPSDNPNGGLFIYEGFDLQMVNDHITASKTRNINILFQLALHDNIKIKFQYLSTDDGTFSYTFKKNLGT